jgi:hypothetical protein
MSSNVTTANAPQAGQPCPIGTVTGMGVRGVPARPGEQGAHRLLGLVHPVGHESSVLDSITPTDIGLIFLLGQVGG